jgi:hypothetical protein
MKEQNKRERKRKEEVQEDVFNLEQLHAVFTNNFSSKNAA